MQPIDSTLEQQVSNDRLPALLRGRDVIIASNREPYRHCTDEQGKLDVDRPTGGLTAGLDPVMQQTGGTWIAWGDGDRDFDVVDGAGCVSVPPHSPQYDLKRLWLSDEQVEAYYYGYSNQVLWPICHSALTRVRCDAGFWQRYCEVNRQFADAVADHPVGRPIVWFQDYHLALAPRMVRESLPHGAVVMHFWHIPWPSWGIFRACPHREELLDGVLANDLLGFHTARYATNFLRCVDVGLPEATVDWERCAVSYRGHTTAVEPHPLGVPVDDIERTTAATDGSFWRSFTTEHGIASGTNIAVGVDRLDYTKGIVERLRALEHLWESRPRWRGELTYVQNASESRSRIPAYRELQHSVARVATRINRRFGTEDWQPIVHVTDRLPCADLYELYHQADMALVTPIRDGMNLVAEEYVAAQLDNDGVLVLSNQAGSHDEFGEYAVSINPFDTERLAHAIDEGLTMPPSERRHRMSRLREWVSAHDMDAWVEHNVEAALRTAPRVAPTHSPTKQHP